MGLLQYMRDGIASFFQGNRQIALPNEGRDLPILDADGREVQDFAVPHVVSFQSIYQGGSKTYRTEIHDEAMRHSRRNALAMGRDDHILACLWERVRAVTSLPWRIEVENDDDPWQRLVRDGLTKAVQRTYWFRQFLRSQMWAIWPGRSGSQVLWTWDAARFDTPRGPQECRILRVLDHQHINGDKIGYTEKHVPFLKVYGGADFDGFKEIYTDRSKAVELVGSERLRFLIHQWNVQDVDFEEGDRADAIHGLGLRNYLYWSWWLRNEYITSVIKSLDRFGLGFIVIEYDGANDKAKVEALDAAKNLSRDRSALVIPTLTNGSTAGAVRVLQTPVAGAQVLLQLQQACELREERLIIGQAGSARSDTSGMGTHDPVMMQETKSSIIAEDANDLAETLTGSPRKPHLLSIIKEHSFPWAKDIPAWFRLDVRPPNVEQTLGAATMAYNLGVRLDEDEIRGLTGLKAPGTDGSVLMNPLLAQQQQQMLAAQQEGHPLPDQNDGPPAAGDSGDDEAAHDPVFAGLFAGEEALAS